jgi:hypothetical protein
MMDTVSDTNNNTRTTVSRINREWFLEVCGDTLVPVYWNHDTTIDGRHGTCPKQHDSEGRVMECPMQPMTIQQYVANCGFDNDGDNNNSNTSDRNGSPLNGVPYLKDWHFQYWYEQYHLHQHRHEFHYTLPNCLPYDLLNGFLLRFDPLATSSSSSSSSSLSISHNEDTTKHRTHYNKRRAFESTASDTETTTSAKQQYNDYRFVYWGPRNSSTDIHSDVLMSLSWSYNVHGTKKWTFYLPVAIVM